MTIYEQELLKDLEKRQREIAEEQAGLADRIAELREKKEKAYGGLKHMGLKDDPVTRVNLDGTPYEGDPRK